MEQPEQIKTVKYITEHGSIVDLQEGVQSVMEYNEDNPDDKIARQAEQAPEN